MMKKIVTTSFAILSIIVVNAQGTDELNQEAFRAVAVIFVMLAFMFFILAIIKAFIQYRLKNKIVDKGIPEHLASSILQTNTEESKNMNVKWFAVLAGLGAGL